MNQYKVFWSFLILIVIALSCGHKKSLNQHLSQRNGCVSLVPSVTEIIFAINAGNMLRGNTNQCDYPAAARQVYKVGDFQTPELERIIALKPAVVFATLPIHARLVERLRELNVRVYISEPQSVDDVFAEIESVGMILGVQPRARQLADSLRRVLQQMPVFGDTPRVYVEIAGAPLMSVGQSSFINDLIRRAGGRNIFDDRKQAYPVVESEEVVARNPDVILILHPGTSSAEVNQRIGWEQLSAVQSGRVYDRLDENLFLRPGPRVTEAILVLIRLLHQVQVR
jgi:iron complex transport system substrate-binding protein